MSFKTLRFEKMRISSVGWEIEEYPRQFGKEPEAITESFTPNVPSFGFCKKATNANFLSFLL